MKKYIITTEGHKFVSDQYNEDSVMQSFLINNFIWDEASTNGFVVNPVMSYRNRRSGSWSPPFFSRQDPNDQEQIIIKTFKKLEDPFPDVEDDDTIGISELYKEAIKRGLIREATSQEEQDWKEYLRWEKNQ